MTKYILVSLLCIGISQAQISSKTKLDSLFTSIEKKHQGMGNFSIALEGKEVYQKSFGFANVSNTQTINETTKFRIGSISKTFTAVIIMQLMDEGKLQLDHPVDNYFPTVPNAKSITIEDLLRHRSGLFNMTEDETIATWITQPQSQKQMIERMVTNGTNFEPKEKTQYSNTNYMLLSFIAEAIEDDSFSNIIKDRIVIPLQLKRTEFGKAIKPENNEALAYDRQNETWTPIKMQSDMSGPMGAGGIVSTATELNTFFTQLFANQLVSEGSLSKMKENTKGIGMGIMKLPFGEMEVYGHGGDIDGFHSFAAHFPQLKISIAVTTNYFYEQLAPTLIKAAQIFFEME